MSCPVARRWPSAVGASGRREAARRLGGSTSTRPRSRCCPSLREVPPVSPCHRRSAPAAAWTGRRRAARRSAPGGETAGRSSVHCAPSQLQVSESVVSPSLPMTSPPKRITSPPAGSYAIAASTRAEGRMGGAAGRAIGIRVGRRHRGGGGAGDRGGEQGGGRRSDQGGEGHRGDQHPAGDSVGQARCARRTGASSGRVSSSKSGSCGAAVAVDPSGCPGEGPARARRNRCAGWRVSVVRSRRRRLGRFRPVGALPPARWGPSRSWRRVRALNRTPPAAVGDRLHRSRRGRPVP